MNKLKWTLIRIKNALLYKVGAHFPFSKVRAWSLKHLGHEIGKKVYFPADLVISQNFVKDRGHLYLGDRVSIGPGVILTLVSHPNASNIRGNISHKGSFIRIEQDCWIGAGAIILNGITIGEGSIVGAGSVVTHDVPSGVVVAGNPAKIIKTIADGDK